VGSVWQRKGARRGAEGNGLGGHAQPTRGGEKKKGGVLGLGGPCGREGGKGPEGEKEGRREEVGRAERGLGSLLLFLLLFLFLYSNHSNHSI
jgi:hypothetical protein